MKIIILYYIKIQVNQKLLYKNNVKRYYFIKKITKKIKDNNIKRTVSKEYKNH
jgi:ribosomal protein L35